MLENDATTTAGYLTPYFDGTPEESLANSVQAYKDIDAWVTNMAMRPDAFDRLQDVIENSGELERRVDVRRPCTDRHRGEGLYGSVCMSLTFEGVSYSYHTPAGETEAVRDLTFCG